MKSQATIRRELNRLKKLRDENQMIQSYATCDGAYNALAWVMEEIKTSPSFNAEFIRLAEKKLFAKKINYDQRHQ